MSDTMSSAPAVPAPASRQRLPWGLRADGDMTRRGLIFAFVLGTIAVFFAFPLGLAGIVLSNMGMNRVATRPELARTLVAWSWIIFAVTDGVTLLLVVAVLASR
jgi:hypothetical protein